MFFRNATMFRFEQSIDTTQLEEALATMPIREPGPMELATAGFVPVIRFGDDEQLLRWCGNSALFCLGYRERVLPSVVVAEELAKRVAAVTDRDGRRVGNKERKQLKEEIISEFLPQAFVRPSRINAYIDVKDGWLVVDTASRKAAEDVVNHLREAFGTFRCTPLTPEESPRVTMTDWLIHGKLPADVQFGAECDLMDPAEGGSKWTGRRTDLETDEVREHLKSGMQVFRLGLTYAERVSFVLGEDLVVRKLVFLDSALDELPEPEDQQSELDARFALMRLELERLFAVFTKTFGLTREPKLRLDGGDAPKGMREEVRGAVKSLNKILGEDGASATLERDGKVVATFGHEPDPLLDEAIAHVRSAKRASITSLQRRFQLGYNRAARLIETMEEMNVVSAPAANGARTVLFLGVEK